MKIDGSNALVTGADGFIGSHLVEALLERGAEVTAFVRGVSNDKVVNLTDISSKINIVRGNILDSSLVRKLVKRNDLIYHLAAQVSIPYSYEHPEEVFDVNARGTLNVLLGAKEDPPNRVVIASSSEIYGTAQYVPIDEDHPLNPLSPYAASKIAADRLAYAFHKTYGLPVVILRPFNTYGPRQTPRAVIGRIITQIIKENRLILGNPEPTRDFVFVKDVCDAYLSASTTRDAIGEVINIGTGREISIRDIAEKIIALFGKTKEIKPIYSKKRFRVSDVMRLCASPEKARKILGWKPKTALEDGLKSTIKWYERFYR